MAAKLENICDNIDVETLKETVIQLVDIVTNLQNDVKILQTQIGKCKCCSNTRNSSSKETYSNVARNSQCNDDPVNGNKSTTTNISIQQENGLGMMKEFKQENGEMKMEFKKVKTDPPECLMMSEITEPVLQSCMEWTVRNRSPTATEEKAYSMAFYTGKPGYRIQFRAQIDRLHGDVYFGIFVLPGIFDEYLSWPFNAKFCLRFAKKSHSAEEFYVPLKGTNWKKDILNNIGGKKVRKYLNETEFVGPFNISQYMNKKDIPFLISLSKYITTKEWKEEWGGKKNDVLKAKFRRLPFNYCSISLQPFDNPLCTKEGVIFDIMNIVPFLKQFKKSPVTGEPMTAKELIKLHFHKNSNDQYHCPVTYKIFNENSTIVAIKTTGNVFAYEAVEELNLKPKNFKDLLTSEPFTRKDVITLQDPSQLEKFNISNFYHIKHKLRVVDEDEEAAKKDPLYRIRKANLETESTLKELDKSYKTPTESYLKGSGSSGDKEERKYLAHYSTGEVSGSFTSTSQDRSNVQQAATLADDIVRYDRVKKLGKKGYVQVVTSHGNINLELHCEMVQKTCENFMKLCEKDYYNNTIFHRLIKHFMVQGGDPTGTGTGGESFWGEQFKDDFKPNLSHSGRGILSMANSGKNTNGSQFFITFRSCQHLDNKHTIFGRVVGGLETLASIESVETDDKDKPLEPIKLLDTNIFVNPFDEVDEQLKKEEEEKKIEAERQKGRHMEKDNQPKKLKVYRSGGVGKYIPTNISKRMNESANNSNEEKSTEAKKKKTSGFGNFSSW